MNEQITNGRPRERRLDGGRIDPYAPIQKAPLYAADSMRSRGYSVRLADDRSPTGWAEVGLVSEDYLLVPNAEVRRMAEDVAEASGLDWNEEKTFFDGKRFAYALAAAPDTVFEEVTVGDVVSVGLLFENSYDGSRRLAASLFAYRLACSNGMLAPEAFARVALRHERANAAWRGEVERALAMLGAAPARLAAFAEAARRLARHRLGTAELAAIRRGPLSKLPVTLWGKTLDAYLATSGDEPTAWGLLNAATGILWHAERPTQADFQHNEAVTGGLVAYALEGLSGDGYGGGHGGGDASEPPTLRLVG